MKEHKRPQPRMADERPANIIRMGFERREKIGDLLRARRPALLVARRQRIGRIEKFSRDSK